jgi:kinesin family member 17
MSAESVRVVVRCRPMNARERDLKCEIVVEVNTKINQVFLKSLNEQNAPPKQFTFDGAYYIDSVTETIYNDVGFPLVESVCEGYNGTIFAYGQTGCGKSFTMQGVKDPPIQKGMIPRAFEVIILNKI